MALAMRRWLITATLIVASCFGAIAQGSSMHTKTDAVLELQTLAAQDHFAADGALYTGVLDPVLRMRLNTQVDSTIGKFVRSVQRKASRKEYLALLASEISGFDRAQLDTEDAEHVAANFERIIDCIGLESSDGVLNNWMYGFDPNQL